MLTVSLYPTRPEIYRFPEAPETHPKKLRFCFLGAPEAHPKKLRFSGAPETKKAANAALCRMPAFSATIWRPLLSPLDVLTALVGQRARRLAGRLAGRLALAAPRLFLAGLEAALHNRFDMLHRLPSGL
jgi:hypothetical protein